MRKGLVAFVTLATTGPVLAQSPTSGPIVAPGTYALTLCHPSCSARGSRVGSGVLVIATDTLVLPFGTEVQRRLRDASMFLLARGGSPNACFVVDAQRQVGGREYYPGIIPAGLFGLRRDVTPAEFPLYRSPDASFVVTLRRADGHGFLGTGWQSDWDGGGWQAGEVEGRRIGAEDPARCRPPGPP